MADAMGGARGDRQARGASRTTSPSSAFAVAQRRSAADIQQHATDESYHLDRSPSRRRRLRDPAIEPVA